VEIDPLIISLAKQYFDLDKIVDNKIVQADAYDVVANPHTYGLTPPFDCVVVDAYSGANFPVKLTSQSFYTNIAGLMADSGCLVVNRIINKNDSTTLGEFKNLLVTHFTAPKIYKVECKVISDNYIFLSRKA
jgi:spermidine synthase